MAINGLMVSSHEIINDYVKRVVLGLFPLKLYNFKTRKIPTAHIYIYIYWSTDLVDHNNNRNFAVSITSEALSSRTVNAPKNIASGV